MFLREGRDRQHRESDSNEVVPLITNHSEITNGCSPPPPAVLAPPVTQEAWTESTGCETATASPPRPQHEVVVIQQPTPSTGPRFRDIPVVLTDSNGVPFTTELRYVSGLFTWLVVGVICVITGSFCCPCLGLVPLCIDQLKDIEHINPETGRVVGKFDRGASFGL